MMKLTEQQLQEAHSHTTHNHDEIGQSRTCACFDCGETYAVGEVTKWIDNGATALCPRCGMDCVLGDAAGFELTAGFLNQMRQRWM